MEKIELKKKIEQEIEKLLNLSEAYVGQEMGIHEIEKGLLGQLLMLGLCLLKYIIAQKASQLDKYKPSFSLGTKYKGKGGKTRKYLSLFGMINIKRTSYWNESSGLFYKLDEYLKLPRDSYWSYNIQELVGESSAEDDFRESVRLMNKLLGLGLSGKSSQRNVDRIGPYVEQYYASNPGQEQEDALYFSASFDGKGVPKIKPTEASRGNPKKRLGKGEKKGVKQMATVTVTSSFTPKQRTSDSIIRSLMGSDLSKVEMDDQTVKTTKENR